METSSSSPSAPIAWGDPVDLDLHGIVGIRLFGAGPADVTHVCRDTGALERGFSRPPDIVVRFTAGLPIRPITWMEPDRSGVTEDGWLFLRQGRATVAIDLANIGSQCEVLCERGAASIPFLSELVNLAALKKGYAAVHAAAFVLDGIGVLVAGRAHSGKTGVLLAFAEQGAEYVGDEWIFLQGDGDAMYGTARDLEIKHWHLRALPRLRRMLPATQAGMAWVTQYLEEPQRHSDGRRRSDYSRLVTRLRSALCRRLQTGIAPQALFGSRVRNVAARPDKVFITLSQSEPLITVERADPTRVALQAQAASCWTQGALWRAYQAWRFAFPELENAFLEQAQQRHREILCRAMRNAETWTLRHPYPFSFSELCRVLEPVLAGQSGMGTQSKTMTADVGVFGGARI